MNRFINAEGIQRELSGGFIRFVIVKGGINFGLSTAAIVLFIDALLSPLASRYVITLVPIFFVGGLAWGVMMWFVYSRLSHRMAGSGK